MAKQAKKTLKFKGKDNVYYERLMQAREIVSGQMQSHAESALNCSEAEKRGVTTHMADVCSDNSRHEMELRLMTEEGNVLELIENAIQRLVDGTYGICQDCGERISEARLEARPYAVYCIKCKSAREKNNRL